MAKKKEYGVVKTVELKGSATVLDGDTAVTARKINSMVARSLWSIQKLSVRKNAAGFGETYREGTKVIVTLKCAVWP